LTRKRVRTRKVANERTKTARRNQNRDTDVIQPGQDQAYLGNDPAAGRETGTSEKE
jgi:hypothetical protein